MTPTLTDTDAVVAAWLATNPTEAEPGAYPKLLYNINLPPVLVHTAEQEKNMGANWRPVIFPGSGEMVTLTPPSDTIAATQETATFHVALTPPGTEWTAVSDPAAPWLTVVSPTTPQTADGDVTYAVEANTGPERMGGITVAGTMFTVTQAAGV
jgi:hypothetical protein